MVLELMGVWARRRGKVDEIDKKIAAKKDRESQYLGTQFCILTRDNQLFYQIKFIKITKKNRSKFETV